MEFGRHEEMGFGYSFSLVKEYFLGTSFGAIAYTVYTLQSTFIFFSLCSSYQMYIDLCIALRLQLSLNLSSPEF